VVFLYGCGDKMNVEYMGDFDFFTVMDILAPGSGSLARQYSVSIQSGIMDIPVTEPLIDITDHPTIETKTDQPPEMEYRPEGKIAEPPRTPEIITEIHTAKTRTTPKLKGQIYAVYDDEPPAPVPSPIVEPDKSIWEYLPFVGIGVGIYRAFFAGA